MSNDNSNAMDSNLSSEAKKKSAPKVFISYSWSSQEHQDKIIALAQDLTEKQGVNVIIDAWSLQAGQDKYKFMESCVADRTITHVLVICDKKYAEKADSREGGVGTEAAIITPEIYNKSHQTKYVPVVFEADEDGQPYLPIFLRHLIYFDLSSVRGNYGSEFDKLIRHLWDKPLLEKPRVGEMPEWLNERNSSLAEMRRLVREYSRNLLNHRKTEDAIVIEYIAQIKMLRSEGPASSNDVYRRAISTKPLQDLFTDFLIQKVSLEQKSSGKDIASFLERINNTLIKRATEDTYDESYNEIVFFLLHELVIRIAAIMVYFNNYKALGQLVNHTYYVVNKPYQPAAKSSIAVFFRYSYMERIEAEYKKQNLDKANCLSFLAEMLIEREFANYASREQLIVGDMFLYQLDHIFAPKDQHWKWMPVTYVYGQYVYADYWMKCTSRAFSELIMPAFCCETLNGFKSVLGNNPVAPITQMYLFQPVGGILQYLDIDKIGTRP